MVDESLTKQLLMLVPAEQAARLMLLTTQERVTAAQWERMLREALAYVDWGSQQERMGILLSQLIPVETLIPNRYRAWRPLVRDAVAFWGAHLPPSRLGPKIIEQILLPVDIPLAQRVTTFMAQMPSLQKIGQMIARNRHLDPAFRAELTRLENAIQDIDPVAIRAEIDRQLGPQLITYAVTVQDVHLAEASVSAAVRFTWRNPDTGAREQGVFKVLKPYVSTYLAEELALLQALADFLDVNRHRYTLPQVHVRELLDEVCHLLAVEVDLIQEQANLEAAAQRYAWVTGVRVPRLIRVLSTPTITAMTEEPGVKVTEAFAHVPWKRRQVATRLIEALLAVPLFAPEQVAVFHADPHAGNLFCDERTGEVILLDWALTQR
jgi:ubiquinone biosynthesis protein